MNPGSEPRDEEALFTAFFREEYPHVVRVAYLMLGERSTAEDVAQEAFVRLFSRWSRVSRYDRPEAWVRRVAIRLASRARSRRSAERALLAKEQQRPDMSSNQDLRDAILRLSPAQRAAVVLYYYEDRPVAEVAMLMGCGNATAKVHLHRARRRLHTLLEEAGHVGR